MTTSRHSSALVFALVLAAYALSFFHRVAPGAIAEGLQASFDINASDLGLLAATYFYVYTVMQIPVGVLADGLGPRFILTAGGLTAALGSLMFGLAPNFAVAVVGRTLVGLGTSVVFIAMLKTIATTYPENYFGRMTGWGMFTGNLGGVAAGLPLAALSGFYGWRGVFIGLGVVSALLAIAAAWKIPSVPRAAGRHLNWRHSLATVLKNPATWPGFFVNIGIAGSFFTFAGLWAAPYFRQIHHFDQTTAGWLVSVYFLAFAVGSVLLGQFSDRRRKRKPFLLLAALVYSLCWLVLVFNLLPSGSLFFSLALCILMGAANAAFTLTWSCAKEVNPPALSGIATSVVNTGVFLGPALLQPLSGWLIQLNWDGRVEAGVRIYSLTDFQAGFTLLTSCVLGSLLIALLVRETGSRNIWREKG